MTPKYVHLKRKPSYISDNPFYSIEDYALICTPVKHNTYPFKTFMENALYDLTVLSNFEESPEKLKTNKGKTVSEQYSSNVIFNDSLFFGFYNVSSFFHYTIMLYVIYKEHSEERMRDMAEKELKELSEIFFFQSKQYSNRNYKSSVYNLLEAFEKDIIDLKINTYQFYKQFVNSTLITINTVASKENSYFKKSLDSLKGNAHIYLVAY